MEEWRDIPGFPGYQVSNLGNARSLDRMSHGRRYKGRLLKPTPDERGYFGCYPFGRIHRAVLLAFVGPCPKGLEGRHRDGNKARNDVDNLVYGTHSENMMDRVEHGTANRGERHGMAKLTEGQVVAIRQTQTSARATARQFAVSERCVRLVRNGERWGWLCQ